MTATTALPRAASASMSREERKVVFASSLGAVFEWYDFLMFGSLSPIAASGNIYFGLWYPVAWALVGAFVTLVFLPETKNRSFQ